MKFFDPCRAQYLLAPVMYDMITFKKMQWLSLVHTEQELRKPGVTQLLFKSHNQCEERNLNGWL